MSDLLSGISNLTKQISNNIPYQIKKLGESVHTMVMNYTEAENLVYEATNEDPWGPTGPQMKEIANYTFQYDGFHQVTNLLWKRMLEDNKNAWRRVYKSLTLLNHLLFHGSERVIGNARDHMFQMRSLEHYKYVDERGRDQGLNVRHRVKVILELLSDDDKLRAQRKKVKSDNKDRYQGFTSEDIRMGRGGTYSSKSANSCSDEWRDDNSDSFKNKSSYDDSRDDYSSKEVNSFQFPDETRRGSASPELGFRADPVADDDFGDFATAGSIPQVTSAAQSTEIPKTGAIKIPALRLPGTTASGTSAAKPPAPSVDLLEIDAPSQVTSTVPPLDIFGQLAQPQINQQAIIPPRPPSGGAVHSAASPALPDDLFGPSSASSAAFEGNFVADWTSAPMAPKVPPAQHQPSLASFGDFCIAPSISSPTSTAVSTPAHTSSALDDMLNNISLMPTSAASSSDSPAKSVTSSEGKPSKTTKVGSTWAGASGLIDLDNLASKNTPVKQGLSLNQMQMNKQALQAHTQQTNIIAHIILCLPV
ncbi:hypothetical protein Q1695_001056 [Nippostrongylus brasiliensis]|nr:hypothetical protein Q1695_001056 [Nippostrongylus brasiliensis]